MIEKLITSRSEVSSFITKQVKDIGYPCSEEIINGLLDIINKLADYHEEGQALYPEVLVVRDLSYFNTFVNRRIKLLEKQLTRGDFSQCVKMCAPLAVNGWNIYLVLFEDNRIEYGLLTSEITALSLDLYEQTMNMEVPEINAIFFRNAGDKVVEVRTVQTQLFVCLNMNEVNDSLDQTVDQLVHTIFPEGIDNHTVKINYLKKVIRQALNEGHGNLIAVVESNPDVIQTVVNHFHGGITLENPIDLSQLANDCFVFHTEEASLTLNSYASLLQSMLNFDGITLFSDNGRIIGYHYIVNNDKVAEENIEGGARSRAFGALSRIDGLKACFMKSQDGRIRFKRNE